MKYATRLLHATSVLMWFLITSNFTSSLSANTPEPQARLNQRIAVVVGNSNYTKLPTLKNATNDSSLVAHYFEEIGYRVIHKTNLTKSGFTSLLTDINSSIPPNSQIIFYYAGHGFQVGSENFLIPVDSHISSIYDVPLESLSLQNIINHVSTRSKVQIFFLDSCRNNPFINKKAIAGLDNSIQKIEAGFSFQAAPVNSLISFSTSPGSLALDGEGLNSPFTQSLVSQARKGTSRDLSILLSSVRREVYKVTNGSQITWESSSLLEPFSFSQSDSIQKDRNQQHSFSLYEVSSTPQSKPNLRNSTKGGALDISLSARFEREINIGESIASSLSQKYLSGDFKIVRPPSDGYIAVHRLGTLLPIKSGAIVSIEELKNMRFFPEVRQISYEDAKRRTFRDEFEIETNNSTVLISLNLKYDACDVEAAGVLDPQGVGINVYNYEINPPDALQACQAAVQSNPEVARFRYQLSRALVANRKFSEAKEELKKSMTLGHIRSYLRMGNTIFLGETKTGGFNRIPASEQVLNYYKIGHQKGDLLATYALGRQFLRYSNDLTIQSLGYDLLMQSKDSGAIHALNELGVFFIITDGDLFDAQRGIRYLEEAVAAGDTDGQNSLGLVLRNGDGGVETDLARAAELFRLAAENGHPIAPTNLARIFATPEYPKHNYSLALKWYDIGLQRGDPWAGTNAAWIILNRTPRGYDTFDGVARAAKSAVMSNPIAAKNAKYLLRELSESEINAGTQLILNELGANLSLDGMFGQKSMDALVRLVGRKAIDLKGQERLLAAAREFWEQNPVRWDLF